MTKMILAAQHIKRVFVPLDQNRIASVFLANFMCFASRFVILFLPIPVRNSMDRNWGQCPRNSVVLNDLDEINFYTLHFQTGFRSALFLLLTFLLVAFFVCAENG